MEQLKSKILSEKPKEKMDLSLSVSKIKTFKDCKAKFRFGYIEKLPKKDWDFLVFGKFLHEVLENFYGHIINKRTDPPNVILTEVSKAAFANWKHKLTREQIDECKQILNFFLIYHNKLDTTVLSVEKSFYIDIDSTVLLNGFIDRIQLDPDGVIHVSDYKTTKNKKYLKNDFFQLLTYAFIMCLEDPALKKVRTSYILLRHGFEEIKKEFERDEIMKVENVFLEYADKIKSEELYRPNPTPLCNYCDYLDICDAGKRKVQLVTFGQDSW